MNKFLLTDDEIVTLEQIIIWISRKYNVKPRIIKLNKFWIFCLKMIYPIYSIFNKLNSSLVYKKSKSNLEFQVKMHSKILKDLKEI